MDIITPDQLTSAYISGMWHGGLGVGLIIFGIIGWPATRYVLGVLAYPFTRRSARKPIGSAYWDKYSTHIGNPALTFIRPKVADASYEPRSATYHLSRPAP